jgi:hypothetical protein
VNLEVVLLDHDVRPDACQQRVLRHGLAAGRGEHAQHIERSPLERHRGAVAGQRAPAQVEPEVAEYDFFACQRVQVLHGFTKLQV